MAEVMVVFGSSTDEKTYNDLNARLKRSGISFDFRVLSAHKTPKELEFEINDSAAEIFIAGAGLAAALPGVIASKKIKPVIGIPCEGAFNGLDSFLSCTQMPPGVPVIAVGVGKVEKAVSLCGNFLHGFTEIALVKKTANIEKEYYEKAKKFLETNKIPFSESPNTKKLEHSKIFVDFVKLGKKPTATQNSTIICPVAKKNSKKDAIKFFDTLQSSYCVGLNNYKNAVIAAIQLANLNGNYSKVLLELRRSEAQKVIESNKQSTLISRSAE